MNRFCSNGQFSEPCSRWSVLLFKFAFVLQAHGQSFAEAGFDDRWHAQVSEPHSRWGVHSQLFDSDQI